MTKTAHHIQNTLPVDLSMGAVLVSLSATGEGAETPAKIKLAPRGKVTTRDDRTYEFEPEILVARFDCDKIEVPIDLEHSLSVPFGDKSQGALAWISKLYAEADGLYGDVRWLSTGKAALAAQTHRYISPTFRHDQNGKATWLHSVALVAAPALSNMPALAHAKLNNNSENTMKLAKLAAALGLTEDASEDAMVAALTAKLDGRVDKSIHEETVTKLGAATTELATLKADTRKAGVSAVLEEALKAKKILPAQREKYERLCATDEGFEQVQALLDVSPAQLGASALSAKPNPVAELAEKDTQVSPAQLAAKASAYQGEMLAKGVTIPIDQAVLHVEAQLKSA